MLLRTVGFVAAMAAAVVQSCQPACEPPPPPPPPPPTGVVIDGQGNGHGRGLSAWGTYGLAVTYGWWWPRILDHYYQGTFEGTVANSAIRVRLMALDDAPVMAVVTTTGTATWNGASYGSIHVSESAPNRYDIYGAADAACPGGGTGWSLIGQSVPGPITVTTPLDESSAAPGDVLGLCQPNGSVIHYRGALTATEDRTTGANRVVNTVLVENYLRGVLSREVSTSWGDAGGGAGMNALYAMAVAARSFAMSQHRYSYGETCDSTSCQVYGGAAYRANPASATSHPAVRVCETGNLTFECANTNRAVGETAGRVRTWRDGRIISGEYSASHGPRSAGGPLYPPVDDWFSNVPQNGLYQWTRTLDAAFLAAHYQLGTLTAARTERDPASIYDGNWGNRIVLTGTAGSVVIPALDFRNAFGLPSHGFVVRGVV